MSLPPGSPAPAFAAPSPGKPSFEFASLGGRYVLLVFLPAPSPERDAAIKLLRANISVFRDDNAVVFAVLPDEASFARAVNAVDGVHWFGDFRGEIRALYRAVDAGGALHPEWILMDPALRVIGGASLDQLSRALEWIGRAGDVDDYAGVPIHAPVLIVPRVLDPDFCGALIACYEADGGAPSGIMKTIDGKFMGVLTEHKKRRDADIPPGPLRDGLRAQIAARLVPQIKRAFQFEVTRIERFIVACYDAADGGYFRPHIDDGAPETAHRKFAVTINLNSEDFEGGDLRFPEYGRRTYRAPTGGAVVFSCSLLHEATPVIRGRRYATLPFLYDEAAARLRTGAEPPQPRAAESQARESAPS